jgi:Protein of unknown function (DUF2652)
MEQRGVFLLLIDISGYTRFTRLHRLSAMHAEQIISDLLENIINRARAPLQVHELQGDSVNFYAMAEGGAATALDLRQQVDAIFDAFRLREGELISDCSLCICDACRNVGQLHLKAVAHYGRAVFTNVSGFRKIAGEDVILAHRLLKNSVPEQEYILETDAFFKLAGERPGRRTDQRTERYKDIGDVPVRVIYPAESPAARSAPRSIWSKLRRSWRNDVYYVRRLFSNAERPFGHLGRPLEAPSEASSQTVLFATRTHRSSDKDVKLP